MIDENAVSVFVPLSINEKWFTGSEKQFLKQIGYYLDGSFIEGEKVWNAYVDLIHNEKDDFILKRIDIKKISGIMSKFIFSLFSRQASQLLLYCDGDLLDKYKIYYLNQWQEIYDYQSGIIDEKLSGTVFI